MLYSNIFYLSLQVSNGNSETGPTMLSSLPSSMIRKEEGETLAKESLIGPALMIFSQCFRNAQFYAMVRKMADAN